MATALTHQIIEQAIGTVDTYIGTANGLYDELNSLISGMTSADFTGDASNGYRDFFTQKVVPALTDNLTAEGNSLTASIKSILDSIRTQLMDTIDPQLGDNNRNPDAA